MSYLVVVVYPDQYRAAEIIAVVQRVRHRSIPESVMPVSVTKDMQGHLRLDQGQEVAATGTPRYDLNIAIADALIRSLRKEGTEGDDTDCVESIDALGVSAWFLKRLRIELIAGRSAIVLLSRAPDTDETLMDICRFSGIVLQTAVADDAEQQLRRSITRQGP